MYVENERGRTVVQTVTPRDEAIFNLFSVVFYDKRLRVATLESIAKDPYPSIGVALAKARLNQMGVQK